MTPEGALKQKVLSSMSSATVTTAAGALKEAYAAVGMAGVGKTTALQGLAGDKDIRGRFPGWDPVHEPWSRGNGSIGYSRDCAMYGNDRRHRKCNKGGKVEVGERGSGLRIWMVSR